jgi:NTP pyrophosphatase (non-canonical NTP hydrolase)
MNMLTYLAQSARTAAGTFFPSLVDARYVRAKVSSFALHAAALDQIKKCLFYNRDTLVWTHGQRHLVEASYEAVPMDVLHALLGVLTEAGELAELLELALQTGEPIDRQKLIDECGDIQWYQAMLYRHLDTTFEDVGVKNITKLSIRFPEKFTLEKVNNKDHAAEDAAFVG